jgi:hypothetical protein
VSPDHDSAAISSVSVFEVQHGARSDVGAAITSLAVELKTALRDTGAVLVRGLSPLTVAEFATVAHAIVDRMVTGNAEHEAVDESGIVQVPVEFSPDRKLLWHNENSFNRRWPLTLMFSPTIVAQTGGRTPLADCRELLSVLDPAIVTRFRERGVAYIRRYGQGLGLPWQRVFGTESREAAEAMASADGVGLSWGGDQTLSTRAVRPAVVAHPLTSEEVWFAQPAHWHPACMDDETRAALLEMFGADGLPRDCQFGDGSAIPDSMMRELLDAYASIERSFDWQAGDVLAIDNVLSAHARDPYTGQRRLLVAMGDEFEFTGPVGPEIRKVSG